MLEKFLIFIKPVYSWLSDGVDKPAEWVGLMAGLVGILGFLYAISRWLIKSALSVMKISSTELIHESAEEVSENQTLEVTSSVSTQNSFPKYNWNRYWIPSRIATEALSIGIIKFNGFLPDLGEFNEYSNTAKLLKEIESYRFLGLLGEPGIGKSTTLKQEFERLSLEYEANGDQVLFKDLNSIGSGLELREELFKNPIFQNWVTGTHNLCLFIDSLDECLIDVQTAAQVIVEGLTRTNTDWNRLKVRLACRSAAWPQYFEARLKPLFTKDEYELFKLAPLQHKNVIEAALREGLDSDAFVGEIYNKNATIFANTPFKLNSLLRYYKQHGAIPEKREELFESQILIYCQESNPSRKSRRLLGRISPEKRKNELSKIAALMLFSGKNTVFIDSDKSQSVNSDMLLTELIQIEEWAEFQAGFDHYQEIFDTPFFSSLGATRLEWSVHNIKEYLTAQYCQETKISAEQIIPLLFNPSGKVLPQLHEVTGWLIRYSSEILQIIQDRNPEVFLAISSDSLTEQIKEKAILGLVNAYRNKTIPYPDYEVNFSHLSFPALWEYLLPIVLNQSEDIMIRRIALQMIRQCRCDSNEIQDELVRMALDQGEPDVVRDMAASSVKRIGNEAHQLKLHPLAEGLAGSDPKDQLKGHGLACLWPAHITTEELFVLLTNPKEYMFFGSYYSFLKGLPNNLSKSDLSLALHWIRIVQGWHMGPFWNLPEDIVLRSLDHLDDDIIATKLSDVLVERIQSNNPYDLRQSREIQQKLVSEKSIRRKLFLLLAERITLSSHDLFGISDFPISEDDVDWAISILQSIENDESKKHLGEIIRYCFSGFSETIKHQFYNSLKGDSILEPIFHSFSPEEIERQKQRLEAERKKWQNQRSQWHDPQDHIQKCIEAIEEKGRIELWQNISFELERESSESPPHNSFPDDLTKSPGWERASVSEKEKYQEIAKRYILEIDPLTSRWIRTNHLPTEMICGYAAWHLLEKASPSILAKFETATWKKWNAIFWRYPISNNDDEDAELKPLLLAAYKDAKSDMIHSLIEMIDGQNSDAENSILFVPRRVELLWDENIEIALTQKLYDISLRPECFGDILESILKHGEGNEALDYAGEVVSLISKKSDPFFKLAVYAGKALFRYRPIESWSLIREAALRCNDFGNELFLSMGNSSEEYFNRFYNHASENDLAELFILLVDLFPYSDDPPPPQGFVSARQQITEVKSNVFRVIKYRKTSAGIDALTTIAGKFPELEWIRWSIPEAQQLMLEHNWNPPKVSEVYALFSDNGKRIVNSEGDLLSVVLESLERLQSRIQDNARMAKLNFWNENKNGQKVVYRPKDEPAFSRVVVDELQRDLDSLGIIINRETRINIGDQTDIRIDAVSRENNDKLTVIIECKGCWNSDLDSAMKNQLVDRYLNSAACRHGIYLVGWYHCDQWDPNCPKNEKKKGKHRHTQNIADTLKELKESSSQLSKTPLVVDSFILDVSL